MNLERLHAGTLSATTQVAAELFPWEHEHQVALPASIKPEDYMDFYRTRGLASVRCWTAIEQDRVCGIASLYEYSVRREELWLAWFGLKNVARGCGAGARFLDTVIEQAVYEGRRALRLWTTDEAEYQAAVRLYLRKGFVPEEAEALPGETWKTWVFSLGLNGQQVMPWSKLPDHGELCGREAPVCGATFSLAA